MKNDELDMSRIEFNIYTNIVADFSEYYNNRMKVYESVLKYLSSVSRQFFITTDNVKVYEDYKKWCEDNNFTPFKQKSFAKFINSCGFELVRTCKGSGTNKVTWFTYSEV